MTRNVNRGWRGVMLVGFLSLSAVSTGCFQTTVGGQTLLDDARKVEREALLFDELLAPPADDGAGGVPRHHALEATEQMVGVTPVAERAKVRGRLIPG